MRNLLLPEIDRLRVKSQFVFAQLGDYGGSDAGMFIVPNKHKTAKLQVIVSSGPWEHASVTVLNEPRCPTWDEMCTVKRLVCEDEETVVQFHPRESEYVNNHPYCLHLWKLSGTEWPLPPSILVGYKN